MPHRHHEVFRISDDLPIEDIQAKLQDVALPDGDPFDEKRVYLDSFDWRLFNDDSILYLDDRRDHSVLTWETLSTGEIRWHGAIKRAPDFADSFSDTPVAAAMAELLEMRTLLPLFELTSQILPYKVLDDEEKTVVRLRLEQDSVRAPAGDDASALGWSLVVDGVRGYQGAFHGLCKRVQDMLPTTTVRSGIFTAACRALGQIPGGYSSKLALKLEKQGTARDAVRTILVTLLDNMTVNEPGTIDDLDSEFLHDFRVAIRRTRSALNQFGGIFDGGVLTRFEDDFRWLGQITGPTRDLDVYLLAIDDYTASLPPQMAGHLGPLRDFLVREQRRQQRALVRSLKTKRYQGLRTDWHGLLTAAETPFSDMADKPMRTLAAQRVHRVLRKLLKQGRAVTSESPAEALHDIRKTCKKLRYLMEFSESLYPAGEVKGLIKTLKAFQQLLGDHQDCEVQALTLTEFAGHMLKGGKTPPETIMAMGALAGQLFDKQNEYRSHFDERFAAFDSKEVRDHFRATFRIEKGAD